MDEDDSQDELINRNTSHIKGKRAAVWAISDDSEDLDESEEGESDGGEEEDDYTNGEDDGEDDEGKDDDDDGKNEDEEEEEEAKPEDGAFGGTSADLPGMSSDEDAEKCPICLNSFNSQPVATPENCEHYFCFDCILEWAKNATSCPVDRIDFSSIYLRKCYGGKVKKMITVQKPAKAGQEETVDLDLEQTSCEVCGGSDREDRLLLCDGCDAGYHMECLTPPLDSVPVEEWFCPECEANNRHSSSVEELSDTDSRPSTTRPATSRSRPHSAGPTRAIARTQQSERVRANVNRHRITQARTSQLAPTYLMRSTWLDETINAVVAGLNTAVYIRDITPRAPSRRRRRTAKRRKVKSKTTSSAKGKKGQVASTGVKRRKRRVRRIKSKKKLMVKKTATPRSRIANNLGIVKDKKSSSLPTVYRPAEHTLSNMRADIGAASLSIYGDPFDLDPFVDREEEEQQAHVTSLLEAKRRGISHSALRSHQPVARPVTASLSRRAVHVPQSGAVVEAAPVPDLLGSILTGQSILLMDSSDVVINRDGSLKAAKPMMPSTSVPCNRKNSSLESTSTLISPGISPSLGSNSGSPYYNDDLPGSSHSSLDRLLTQSSSHSPSLQPSSSSHTQPTPHSDLPPRGNLSVQSLRPNGPTPSPSRWGASGIRAPIETTHSSVHPIQDSDFNSKGLTPSQSQPKKAPAKPMWVDVSVLPRIPKIKRESSSVTTDGTSQSGSHGSNRVSSSRGSSSNNYSIPETGMNSLSGDKGRQQSVDQQKGQADSQTQRHRPDGASSSSAFSNSFSSSSSGAPANQQRYASSSSSSSTVSFRINSSGNSWHTRRLSIASSSSTEATLQETCRKKYDEAKKKQLHKDKQMLLSSRTLISKERDNNIYDPFNPTLSDSSSSGDEAESANLNRRFQQTTYEGRAATVANQDGSVLSKQGLVQVKTEAQEFEVSQGSAQNTASPEVGFSGLRVKAEQELKVKDVKNERQTIIDTKVKKEQKWDDVQDSERCDRVKSHMNSQKVETTPAALSLERLKTEKDTQREDSGQYAGPSNRSPLNNRDDSSASDTVTTKKKQEGNKSNSTSPKSPAKDLGHKKQTSKALKEQQSSSSETDRSRREDPASGQGSKKERDKDRDRSSRRSWSRERRRARSSSDSSQPYSPDSTRRKRRPSRSKDETRSRRSRSCSSSGSRDRSRKKKEKRRSKERNDGREREYNRRRLSEDKRRGRSHSKSKSKSRSRSRSRSRSKDHKRGASPSKSRSRSRERKKEKSRGQHTSLSSRDKAESQSKDKKRNQSRSSSRDRRKGESSSRTAQTSSGPSVSSSRDSNRLQERQQKDSSQKNIEEEKCAKVSKQELPSCSVASQIKKEDGDLSEENQTKATAVTKEIKNHRDIKEEKQPSLDIFEEFLIDKPLKSEETDTQSLALSKNIHEVIEDPIKTESCEMTINKSEFCPLPPVTSLPTLTTPVAADCLQETVSKPQPVLVDSDKQPSAVGLTVSIKQEPADSDDDFNVDVMLDNLDYVKSEHTEGSGVTVKQEKEEVEGKNEGEQVSTVVGTKSKTQVKRVTWNIQEPEGPQPEKSASKLALYKLKLKQEGVRRPFIAAQTSSQDIAGAGSNPSNKEAVGLFSDCSSSDGLHPKELSSSTKQGEVEDGDLSRKDKQYLKKLHMQERAIEEVKLAIKPFYQRRDINKDEYKEILRKAVQKVCHSKSGEINPVKVGNLVKAYVDKYKHARKHKKGEDSAPEAQTEAMKMPDSP
ncbi:PHD and RING finger domain-containing protein 1 isoform X3 [Melanotaenia boesemani]|uniref:PHD and RING finger domain-containing protein 1 isoform X3 n=1 Tax=Melanotaenia boesemani TaxID=1250792 RepID=UPI001C03D5D6|nr:PHD and RING finger domain-containing protein 1 isoform X3 [Melanotaenia boesemani]